MAIEDDPGPVRPRLTERMPELGALELFLSVARLGSISQAAACHGMSQPAAGSRIRHLEDQLGLALIERSARGSRLTRDGQLVLDWACQVVAAGARLEAGVEALRGRNRAQLRLGASLTLAEYVVPGWIVGLKARCPHTTVVLHVVNSGEVLALLRSGAVDLGFVECPQLDSDLSSRVVARDELVFVVSPGHPWARRSRPVSATELAATPLVRREAGSGTRSALEQALAPFGPMAPPVAEISSTAAIKSAVAAGVGPAALSCLAVAEDIVAGRLARVETDATVDLHRDLLVVWVTGRTPVGAVRTALRLMTGQRRGS